MQIVICPFAISEMTNLNDNLPMTNVSPLCSLCLCGELFLDANPDSEIEQISHWLASSRSAVVLTGAGISTESGIPDFRSPGGVWSKYRTVYFDEFLASADGRHEYWRQKCEMHRDFAAAEPNAGHQILARWEAAGRIRGVITQNIDGLHQLAGSRRVLELHGTARQAACLDCTARYDIDPLVEQFLAENRVPDCPAVRRPAQARDHIVRPDAAGRMC